MVCEDAAEARSHPQLEALVPFADPRRLREAPLELLRVVSVVRQLELQVLEDEAEPLELELLAVGCRHRKEPLLSRLLVVEGKRRQLVLSAHLGKLDQIPADVEELDLRARLRGRVPRTAVASGHGRLWRRLDVSAQLLEDEVPVLEHLLPGPDALAFVRYSLSPDIHRGLQLLELLATTVRARLSNHRTAALTALDDLLEHDETLELRAIDIVRKLSLPLLVR